MGGHPYYYAVPYQPEINKALQALRKQEFEPGKQHRSIEDALEASDADGARSILDVERIGNAPGFRVATPARPNGSHNSMARTNPRVKWSPPTWISSKR